MTPPRRRLVSHGRSLLVTVAVGCLVWAGVIGLAVWALTRGAR